MNSFPECIKFENQGFTYFKVDPIGFADGFAMEAERREK